MKTIVKLDRRMQTKTISISKKTLNSLLYFIIIDGLRDGFFLICSILFITSGVFLPILFVITIIEQSTGMILGFPI